MKRRALFVLNIADNNLRTFFQEEFDASQPDAAGATGDDSDFSLQFSDHSIVLSCLVWIRHIHRRYGQRGGIH